MKTHRCYEKAAILASLVLLLLTCQCQGQRVAQRNMRMSYPSGDHNIVDESTLSRHQDSENASRHKKTCCRTNTRSYRASDDETDNMDDTTSMQKERSLDKRQIAPRSIQYGYGSDWYYHQPKKLNCRCRYPGETHVLSQSNEIVLQRDHPSCQRLKFLCPGQKVKGQLWTCPLNQGYKPSSRTSKRYSDSKVSKSSKSSKSSSRQRHKRYGKGRGRKLPETANDNNELPSSSRKLTWENWFNAKKKKPMMNMMNMPSSPQRKIVYLPSYHFQCLEALSTRDPTPSPSPQFVPTNLPTGSNIGPPTQWAPTNAPTGSSSPTPSASPTASEAPSASPSTSIAPSESPTSAPSAAPSPLPSGAPVDAPIGPPIPPVPLACNAGSKYVALTKFVNRSGDNIKGRVIIDGLRSKSISFPNGRRKRFSKKRVFEQENAKSLLIGFRGNAFPNAEEVMINKDKWCIEYEEHKHYRVEVYLDPETGESNTCFRKFSGNRVKKMQQEI